MEEKELPLRYCPVRVKSLPNNEKEPEVAEDDRK